MKKKSVSRLEISQIRKALNTEKDTYFGYGLAINMNANARALFQTLLIPNQPYSLSENRIILITEGNLQFRLNLTEYVVAKGDIALIPTNSIIEITEISDDYCCRMVTFEKLEKTQNTGRTISDPIIIKNQFKAAMHCDRIISSLFELSTSKVVHRESSALLLNVLVKYIEECEPYMSSLKQSFSRQDVILNEFLKLVHQNCTIHRDLEWYADSLCVSKHYLHHCVSSASGKTAKGWISLALVQEARHLLKHTDLPSTKLPKGSASSPIHSLPDTSRVRPAPLPKHIGAPKDKRPSASCESNLNRITLRRQIAIYLFDA